MPNGIDLILADHRRVHELFSQFAETHDGTLIGQVVDALHAHDGAEHAALYPLVEGLLHDDELAERLAAANSHIKKQIDLLVTLEGSPLIDAFLRLQTLVADHVNDEEKHVLPVLRERATPQQLETLGARISQAKQRVG